MKERESGERVIGAIGRAEREVPISVIISALCHLISSPPAQTWQQKKKKAKENNYTSYTSPYTTPSCTYLLNRAILFSFFACAALHSHFGEGEE